MMRGSGMWFGLGLLVAGASPLAAQPVNGLYVAGAGGLNLQAPTRVTPDKPIEFPRQGESATSVIPSSIGPATTGSVGYGFGNGWRMEVEGNQRR